MTQEKKEADIPLALIVIKEEIKYLTDTLLRIKDKVSKIGSFPEQDPEQIIPPDITGEDLKSELNRIYHSLKLLSRDHTRITQHLNTLI